MTSENTSCRMNALERRKILRERANDSPIWLLEMRVSRQNKLLIELKSQGIIFSDNKWRKVVQKRNIYRKILLNKLKEWDKGKIKESNPSYSDYLDYNKDKLNNMENKE